MRFKFRRGRKCLRSGQKIFIAAALILAVGIYIFQAELRPIIRTYASVQVRNAVYKLINEQVEEVLSSDNITYDSLVTLVKDSEGRVSALTTNMAAMNSFKTKVTNLILQENQELTAASFDIPIGTLTGNEFLSGYGPKIAVKLTPISAIESSYSNSFSSAGINQTRHQIMMNFSASVGILLPGYNDKADINIDICVAETVIVGAAPQFFASIGRTDLDNYTQVSAQ